MYETKPRHRQSVMFGSLLLYFRVKRENCELFLSRILNIRWKDKVANITTLSQSNMKRALMKAIRGRKNNQVFRTTFTGMNDEIEKSVMNGNIEGKRAKEKRHSVHMLMHYGNGTDFKMMEVLIIYEELKTGKTG